MTINNLRLVVYGNIKNTEFNLDTSSSNEPSPSEHQQIVLDESAKLFTRFIPDILSNIDPQKTRLALSNLKNKLFTLSQSHFLELDNQVKELFSKIINEEKIGSSEPENWIKRLKINFDSLSKSEKFNKFDVEKKNEIKRIASELLGSLTRCYINHIFKTYKKIVKHIDEDCFKEIERNTLKVITLKFINDNYQEEIKAVLPYHTESPVVLNSVKNVLKKVNQLSPNFRFDLVTTSQEKKESSGSKEQKFYSVLLENAQENDLETYKSMLNDY